MQEKKRLWQTMQKEDFNVIALIGDGAATGGLAFEGLNDASVSNEPMIIILNDNMQRILMQRDNCCFLL